MRSPGINGEEELKRQPAIPGSPGEMAVSVVCVSTILVNEDEFIMYERRTLTMNEKTPKQT